MGSSPELQVQGEIQQDKLVMTLQFWNCYIQVGENRVINKFKGENQFGFGYAKHKVKMLNTYPR